MQPEFLEAFTNSSYSVFGYELKPICARHLMELEARKIKLDNDIAAHDLFIVCKILSRNTGTPDLTFTIKDWWTTIKIKNSKTYLKNQYDLFSDYLNDHESYPLREESTEHHAGFPLGSPFILSAVVIAASKLGIKIEDAWTIPFCQLAWYIASYDEINGGDCIRDLDTEKEIMQQLKEAEKIGEELLKARKAQKKCQK